MEPWHIVLNFVPMCIVFYASVDPRGFLAWSTSYIGRLFAVAGIIAYSLEDRFLGTAACLIAILFYQSTPSLDAFTSYGDAYPPAEVAESAEYAAVGAAFRKDNCEGGVLSYKSFVTRPELAEFVYPNLIFKEGACNPCDTNCRFSLN
jgi:hypothetical protein